MVRVKETEWQRRTRRDRERAAHVEAHGPGCQVCGAIPKTRGLHEDHDHRTGLHRGWLCHSCNRRLWPGATVRWLLAAALYLAPPLELTDARPASSAVWDAIRGYLACSPREGGLP